MLYLAFPRGNTQLEHLLLWEVQKLFKSIVNNVIDQTEWRRWCLVGRSKRILQAGLWCLWRKVKLAAIQIPVTCHPLAIWHGCQTKIYAASHICLMSCLGSAEYSAKSPVMQHHLYLNLLPWVWEPTRWIKTTKINSCLRYTRGSEEPNRLRNRNRTGARDEAKNQTSITEVSVDVMRTLWRDFLCVNRSVHSCTGAMLPGCCCSVWNANCITSFIRTHGARISLDLERRLLCNV